MSSAIAYRLQELHMIPTCGAWPLVPHSSGCLAFYIDPVIELLSIILASVPQTLDEELEPRISED
jgi:hypothetical protein